MSGPRSCGCSVSIEVLVASGEREDAAALADQLLEFGTAFDSSALRSTGDHALALVALARGESETALMAARRGAEEWAELGAPYEVARCRVLVGRTLGRSAMKRRLPTS